MVNGPSEAEIALQLFQAAIFAIPFFLAVAQYSARNIDDIEDFSAQVLIAGLVMIVYFTLTIAIRSISRVLRNNAALSSELYSGVVALEWFVLLISFAVIVTFIKQLNNTKIRIISFGLLVFISGLLAIFDPL